MQMDIRDEKPAIDLGILIRKLLRDNSLFDNPKGVIAPKDLINRLKIDNEYVTEDEVNEMIEYIIARRIMRMIRAK